jgi:RNA polymerase sigma factor (sigma-70 family)
MHSSELESLLLQHLEHVEAVARFVCRRSGLSGADADECCSWVSLRLVERDYVLLRKHRGESSLKTYLTVVVTMLVRDFRIQLRGRWRPSAVARRLGPVACRLETLLFRDRLTLQQATAALTSGEDSPSTKELSKLASQLPRRDQLRPALVGDEVLTVVPGSRNADTSVLEQEREEVVSSIETALNTQLATLSTEDHLVMKMLFVEGLTIAQVARGLAIPQRPLYRRVERLCTQLRAGMERAGVSRDTVRALLHEAAS